MDILGLDAGQWTPMEAVDTYTASVSILGVNATAVAWQVWQDDTGSWTAYHNDKEVEAAFGAVFVGDVFGWRGMREHGYGFGMEPVHVDAWDGDFVFAIVTVGKEPEPNLQDLAAETGPSFGVDFNYDGEIIGLWFDPEMVEVDELGRVWMSYQQLCQLSEYIEEAIVAEQA